MNRIIFCEGKTDAILLGYFLIHVCGFTVIKKGIPKELIIDKSIEKNASFTGYERNGDYLAIWGVGGKDYFVGALEKFHNRLRKYSDSEIPYEELIIICDRDNKKIDKDVFEGFSDVFKNAKISFENRKLLNGFYENTFGESKKLSTLGIIIPKEEDGALETALLESIRETPSDKEIVDRSTRFVTDIRSVANDYIKTDRLELKAKLATVFAIMSPEKVFGFIDELLMTTVKWEEKSTLMELFEPLIQLIGYKH